MYASGFNPAKSQAAFKSTVIGDYRLLALVGQGQFAQVYAAMHLSTGRLAAIKQTRHVRESASQEPLVMQRLDHPNIVSCQDISKTALGYQLVLEYCEGGTLRSHLASTLDLPSPLPLLHTKHLIGDILKGLSHIHQQGIVHGDLKPENIFITHHSPRIATPQKSQVLSQSQPRLKIGDFGSARFIDTPSRSCREIGSPIYAAPERFTGQSSPASDLYSVGVMLYELLLGNRPFSGSPEALQQAHQTQPVPLPSTLTFAARQLLTTALHKQPEQRFPTAEAMLRALHSLTSTKTTALTHPLTLPSGLARSSLNQAIAPIPANGIMAPVEALLSIPQGCCIITERSLHILTPKRKLLSIARFSQPCWISVSPSGKWFAAIAKQNNSSRSKEEQNQQFTTKSIRRYSKGMLGHLSDRSGHRWRRAIAIAGPLLTTLQASVLQIIALDDRHLLRVSITPSTTYFECFTRRGRFIGRYTLDLPLAQVTPTMVPYQLIALSRPTQHADAAVVLITLNPFQVRHIHLPALSVLPEPVLPEPTPPEPTLLETMLTKTILPERVNAFPWGYLISYQRRGLLLDRSAQIAGLLTGLPPNSAIAAINNQNMLLASAKHSNATTSPVNSRHGKGPSSLLVADLSSLDLGIIF